MGTAQDKSKAQLPAPTLFLGPHSRNASSISQASKDRLPASRQPISRGRSLLAADSSSSPFPDAEPAATAVPRPAFPPPAAQRAAQKPALQRAGPGGDHPGGGGSGRAEAVWAAMQSTLEEVELSAAAGARVFGADHARALDGLRTAQIALAQAWARSSSGEAEEPADDDGGGGGRAEAEPGAGEAEAKEDKAAAAAAAAAAAGEAAPVTADVLAGDLGGAGERTARERSGSLESGRSRLEEETENDIALARRRREANDRYFRVVNTAVKDVVAKLEDVARAMKEVEIESKDIWEDSVESASVG
jgi:hypothetical protein